MKKWKFWTNIHLETLAKFTKNNANCLLTATFKSENVTYISFVIDDLELLKCKITYPLHQHKLFNIKFDDNMTVGDLIWRLAKEYQKIYKNPEKYGVWGHDFGDLVLEGFSINEKGEVEFFVGS